MQDKMEKKETMDRKMMIEKMKKKMSKKMMDKDEMMVQALKKHK